MFLPITSHSRILSTFCSVNRRLDSAAIVCRRHRRRLALLQPRWKRTGTLVRRRAGSRRARNTDAYLRYSVAVFSVAVAVAIVVAIVFSIAVNVVNALCARRLLHHLVEHSVGQCSCFWAAGSLLGWRL